MSAFQEFQMEQTWKLRVLEAKGLANEFQQTKWEQQVGKYWDLIIILYMQYMNIYIYIHSLGVLTILKNMSQCEGLSQILWKIKNL